MTYLLKFQMKLGRSSTLIIGGLQLLKDGKVINEFRATSSSIGNQYRGSWAVKFGLLPPRKNYTVRLDPFPLHNQSGIDGNFYQLLPFAQKFGNVQRADFGIHPDWWLYGKGGKGTNGCIGIQTKRGWSAFEREINAIKSEFPDLEFLPLEVVYS